MFLSNTSYTLNKQFPMFLPVLFFFYYCFTFQKSIEFFFCISIISNYTPIVYNDHSSLYKCNFQIIFSGNLSKQGFWNFYMFSETWFPYEFLEQENKIFKMYSEINFLE